MTEAIIMLVNMRAMSVPFGAKVHTLFCITNQRRSDDDGQNSETSRLSSAEQMVSQ
jgi:hypothetical protein